MKPKTYGSLIVALLSLFITESTFAMSVSWQGSTAVMTKNQPFLTDWVMAYSFRSDAAFAFRYMRMTMRDGAEMEFYGPQFDYLVHRWNGRDYQANIYVDGAFGAQNAQGRKSTMGVGTLDADIESRDLYLAGKVQGNWGGIGPDIYQSEVRLGIAPYKAGFEEIASWLIVSIQSNPQLSRTFSITPMVRLFYKSFLVEVGASHQGDWMFNSMIHF
jgi:hypothetical protein